MLIYIVSDNPMLVKSVDLMLSDPALGMTLRRAEGRDLTPRGARAADLVLLDAEVAVPKRGAVQRLGGAVPVIVISAPESADPGLPGFDEADHLVTPFHRQDLVTRIHTAVAAHRSARSRRIVIGPLEVDLAEREAFVNGQHLPLTGKEYEVLEFLAMRRGVTLTKEMFLDKLYGGIDEPEIKIIDVFICKIRRKIRQITGGDTLIETVWGRGYVLREPQEAEDGETESPARRRSAAG